MFELSGNTQFLYCIKCSKSDFVHQSTGGTQFHIDYKITSNDSGFYAEPVECFGPFVHSEEPEQPDWEFEAKYYPVLTPHLQYFEETDIDQLVLTLQ